MQLAIVKRKLYRTPPGQGCWVARCDAAGNEVGREYRAKGGFSVDEELVAVESESELAAAVAEFKAKRNGGGKA